jgi:hypothetical protein
MGESEGETVYNYGKFEDYIKSCLPEGADGFII